MTVKETYSNNDVNRAGIILSQQKQDSPSLNFAFSALSYWRYSHNTPLLEAYRVVVKTAEKIDKKAIVAKRLKRNDSIIIKLTRFPSMKLRSMNDIAGCRVVLADEKRLRRFLRELKKDPHFQREDGYKINNYIDSPQEDGYRSIHIIAKFSNSDKKSRNVEVQLRTSLQHCWATAVEIIDLITNQRLKHKEGDKEWQAFFSLVSDQLARLDKIPSFHSLTLDEQRKKYAETIENSFKDGNEETKNNIIRISKLSNKLNVQKKLRGFAASLRVVDEHIKDHKIEGFVLIELDLKKMQLNSKEFEENDTKRAESELTRLEKNHFNDPDIICALISTTAIDGLKEAFPNYFADSSKFLAYLKIFEEASTFLTPNRWMKFLLNLNLTSN